MQMSFTTFRRMEVFVLLLYVGGSAYAFAPGTSFHSRLPGQSLQLGSIGEEYTTTCDDDNTSTSSPCRHTSNANSIRRSKQPLSRRIFASRAVNSVTATSVLFATSLSLLTPGRAAAGIDVSSLKTMPIEGDASGAALRLKQLQQGTATTVQKDVAVRLDSGVAYRESVSGSVSSARKGVQNGLVVGATIRISTPSGLPIYSTRDDNESNELSWKVGSGDFPRGAEEGMMGMRLGSVRRIEVPSEMVFAARNMGALPEATTEAGRDRYNEVFRTGDARLVFDVRVTGINPGDGRI